MNCGRVFAKATKRCSREALYILFGVFLRGVHRGAVSTKVVAFTRSPSMVVVFFERTKKVKENWIEMVCRIDLPIHNMTLFSGGADSIRWHRYIPTFEERSSDYRCLLIPGSLFPIILTAIPGPLKHTQPQ